MKNGKNKTVAAIALFLMIAPLLMAIVPVDVTQAQTPTDTVAYLSFIPNPVGVDQILLVNMYVVPSCPSPFHLYNFSLDITSPDGDTETFTVSPATSDNTAYLTYTPTQIGTYKLKLRVPEQLVQGTSSGFFMPSVVNLLYRACESPEMELVVQNESVVTWPEVPLPSYYERPIHPENRQWGWRTGDWLMALYNASERSFNPYSTGPESSHILWKFQTAIGGIIGGDMGAVTYQGGPSANLAMAGYVFLTLDNSDTYALDIKTGEVKWVKNGIPSSYGMYDLSYDGAQGYEPMIVTVSNNRLLKYDPFSGSLRTNVTGLSISAFEPPYIYSIQNPYSAATRRLVKWDATGGGGGFFMPTTDTFANRIVYNVSFPFSGITGLANGVGYYRSMMGTGDTIGAFNTEDGSILWQRASTDADRETVAGCGPGAYGKYILTQYYPDLDSKVRLIRAVDLYTGNTAWMGEPFLYPWGTFHEYFMHSAYNMFYVNTYAGIYALDADTGEIVWNYTDAPEYPYENVFGASYPFFSFGVGTAIADGKIYVAGGEHSPNQPIARGYKLHCINATSGEAIWVLEGFTTCGSGAGDNSQAALIADGVLVMGNRYDNNLYAFGVGESKLTVAASSKIVEKGKSLLIEGTITDQSPAQEGTGCVSDASMSDWMEYLHMQRTIPTNATGVEVILDSMGPNGTYRHIQRVTSEPTGTFAYTLDTSDWEPGQYQIIATFLGSKAYAGSYGIGYFSVEEAPEVPVEEPEPVSIADTYFVPAVIGVIIAIAVVGLLLFWQIRKR